MTDHDGRLGRLPGRDELIEQTARRFEQFDEFDGAADESARGDWCATFCAVRLDGTAAAVVPARLDRLIRSKDLLGQIDPDTYVVASPALDPTSAGTVVERIRGAVAMPVDIDGETVSPRCDVGVAFVALRRGDDVRRLAGEALDRATGELQRQIRR